MIKNQSMRFHHALTFKTLSSNGNVVNVDIVSRVPADMATAAFGATVGTGGIGSTSTSTDSQAAAALLTTSAAGASYQALYCKSD